MESQDNIQAELDKHRDNSEGVNPALQISLNNNLDTFNLNSILNIRSTSRFYKFVVDTSTTIQEKLRSMVLASQSLIRPLTVLQKKHLASKLVQLRVQQNKITVDDAIQHTATVNLWKNPNQPFNFLSSVESGLTPFEAQHFWITDTHITALNAGISFNEISGLTDSQILAILTTRPDPTTASPIIPKTLTRKDVEGIHLSGVHIQALKKGWDFSKIVSLSELQLNALLIGFTNEDIQQLWLSPHHIEVVKKEKLTIEITRGLTSFQLQAIQYGVPLSEVKELSIGAHHIQAMAAGFSFRAIKDLTEKQLILIVQFGCTLEQATNPLIVKMMIEDPSYNSECAIGQAFQKGYKIEQIVNLLPAQCALISRNGCTLEQATNPLVLKMLIESGDSRMASLIGTALKKGYNIAEIATLSAAQCMLLVDGCTFEQIRDPIILKLLDENKDIDNAAAGTIGNALQKDYKIEQLENMTPTQFTLIGNFGCTFEQVTDPKCLEFFKKNKKERLENLIGALLGQGYKLEQIAELPPSEFQALSSAALNEQKCLENSILFLLEQGYKLEQIVELSPSQFQALSSPANNDNPPLLFSGASTLKSTKDTSSDDELTKTKDSLPQIGFDCV